MPTTLQLSSFNLTDVRSTCWVSNRTHICPACSFPSESKGATLAHMTFGRSFQSASFHDIFFPVDATADPDWRALSKLTRRSANTSPLDPTSALTPSVWRMEEVEKHTLLGRHSMLCISAMRRRACIARDRWVGSASRTTLYDTTQTRSMGHMSLAPPYPSTWTESAPVTIRA